MSERFLTHKEPVPLALTTRHRKLQPARSQSPTEDLLLKEAARCSMNHNGIVKAYAANTSEGLVRDYNEDRVSIIYNIVKPSGKGDADWPICSYFGVFDGHGGAACADFLRDSLHHFVIKQSSFPVKPKKALIRGFEEAEAAWTEIAMKDKNSIERSGSCAVVMLVVGEICYIANLGDSRAILSADYGRKVYALSKDHKPSDEAERTRILAAGGEVYQTQVSSGSTIIQGVHRIMPGRLSVSRSFGDIEAKEERYGGNHKVLITVPDVKTFRVSDSYDFVLLACDGIFDKLSNKDAVSGVWQSFSVCSSNINKQCGSGVDSVMKIALKRETLDNVTVVLVAFNNFKKAFHSNVHN